MNLDHKSFCVLPWLHSFVNINGNYQVCCTSEEFHLGIQDEEGKFLNIKNRPSLESVVNSNLMKELRKRMLEGRWSEGCTRCFNAEKSGGISRRIIENNKYADQLSIMVNGTSQDGAISKFEIKYLDYRLGNLCNLECRMCGPHSSSRWIKDWNTVKPENERITPETKAKLESFDWIEQECLIEEFKEKVVGAEHLHFAGGEPLINPQMAKMLKICIDLNVAHKMTLSYNTNLTQLPPSVLELWKKFKAIRLLVSVDGFGKVNDYIRYPSKWEVIDKNLTFLDEHFKEYKIEEVLLSTTVQIYNVLSLRELYHYLTKFKNVIPAMNLVNLYTPSYLKTTLLPADAKKLATQRLLEVSSKLKNVLPATYSYLEGNIHQIITFMNQDDLSSQLPVFKTVNGNIDRVKNVKLSDHIPELSFFLGS